MMENLCYINEITSRIIQTLKIHGITKLHTETIVRAPTPAQLCKLNIQHIQHIHKRKKDKCIMKIPANGTQIGVDCQLTYHAIWSHIYHFTFYHSETYGIKTY